MAPRAIAIPIEQLFNSHPYPLNCED
jgi:hypothetical protein